MVKPNSAACALPIPCERFTRKKDDPSFPRHAVEYCLNAGGIGVEEPTHVGFYHKPVLKFKRILETDLGIPFVYTIF